MTKLLTNRALHFVLLFALLMGAVVYTNSERDFRTSLHNLIFDFYQEAKPRPRSDQVIIVDYDDESLARIGQWPWPRHKIAELIAGLDALGAKVIAFDGVLPEPDRASPKRIMESLPASGDFDAFRQAAGQLPDNDVILAEQIKTSARFVAGFTHGQIAQPVIIKKPVLAPKNIKGDFLRHCEKFGPTSVFLPELVKASAGHGSFMAKPEFDGIIRLTGLLFTNQKQLYPSLSLEALRLYGTDGKDSYKIWADPDGASAQNFNLPYRILIGDYKIPVDVDGLVRVYFRKFDRPHDYVSAYKVMDPAYAHEIAPMIKDRIVFIGSSAEGLKDLRSSPLDLFIPGVEVHANVTEQMLQGVYLYRSYMNIVAEAAFILCGGLLMIILAPFVSAVVLLILCFGLIGAAILGSWLMFDWYGLLLDPVYPSLAVFVIFIVSSMLTYIRLEVERRQVRAAFSLYISPDFMKELTSDPDKLTLGGEVRELSVMFTDIRSFTTISESLTPKELINLMNDFLTPMSDLVMSNRGTIDKYMGDAMMAFWNAPLDDAEHARHACLTALGMNAALVPINEALQAQTKKEGRKFMPLEAGIGINTGPASVGNMGSKQRFAYSALGDTVNVASRLEGQTKTYGVSILIGEETYKQVTDFAVLELDLVQVKGKTEPARIYTLLGDDKAAALTAFKLWKQAHDDMLAAYRAGDFIEAENILLIAKERAHLTLVDYYVMMMGRIQNYQKQHPGPEWDGVYVATSK